MYSIFKIHRSEDKWLEDTGTILFTWSIINPNGPTLNCVGLRNSGSPGQLEVFYRWFHFHGGESFILGYVTEGSKDISDEILQVLRYAFSQEVGRVIKRFPLVSCVPSFLTIENDGNLISSAAVRDLVSNSNAFQDADWGREIYYLKKYGDQFFSRGAEETRFALELALQDPDLSEDGRQYLEMTRLARGHLSGFNDWKPNQYVARPFSDGDLNFWWTTVTKVEFTTNCLIQIAEAWVGATYQVRHTIPEPTESFEFLKGFLESHNCFLWPVDWDSAFLQKRMGLD
jgi:hypothetical protein